MTKTTCQNNINQALERLAKLKAEETKVRSDEVMIKAKTQNLERQLLSSKSKASQTSIQRRIQSESKKLIQVGKKLARVQKDIAKENKVLTNNQRNIEREIKREDTKQRKEELKFLKERQRFNQSELSDIRRVNSLIERRQTLFSNYTIPEEKLSSEDEEYNFCELKDLHKRIDEVLENLEKLGFGQEILFDEIEELKRKSKKITKKDLNLLLIGKLMAFGTGLIEPDSLKNIFEAITDLRLSNLEG